MDIEKRIEDIYKGLFYSQFIGVFELNELTCQNYHKDKRGEISFDIVLRVDYLKSNKDTGSAIGWGKLLQEIENELRVFFDDHSWSVTKNKVIFNSPSREMALWNMFFVECNLVFDEKHEVFVSCNFVTDKI